MRATTPPTLCARSPAARAKSASGKEPPATIKMPNQAKTCSTSATGWPLVWSTKTVERCKSWTNGGGGGGAGGGTCLRGGGAANRSAWTGVGLATGAGCSAAPRGSRSSHHAGVGMARTARPASSGMARSSHSGAMSNAGATASARESPPCSPYFADRLTTLGSQRTATRSQPRGVQLPLGNTTSSGSGDSPSASARHRAPPGRSRPRRPLSGRVPSPSTCPWSATSRTARSPSSAALSSASSGRMGAKL